MSSADSQDETLARTVAEADAAVFALLRGLARGASSCALPLPAAVEETVEPWRGLGFNVGGIRLVAELGEVLEVLALPALTPVPGVRPWLSGIANVRGRLLPVVDLCRYLGLERSTARSVWRVLVVEDGDLYCGLLVEESFGMLQFELQDMEAGPSARETPASVSPYLRGHCRQGSRHWHVVDLRALVREPAFFDIAATSTPNH